MDDAQHLKAADEKANWREIKTCKWIRSLEASLEIFFQLLGVYATFLLFNLFGEVFMGEDFSTSTLFSLLLFPALYILKTGHTIFSPFFVKVRVCDVDAESRTGIFTQRLDKLNLENAENIEVVSTILARIFNYGTIHIYTYGSWVSLPFVVNADELKDRIESKDWMKND